MSDLPGCPECQSEYVYEDGALYVCPECAHEWAIDGAVGSVDEARVVNDAYGNVLNDGDSVTVIKDLKVKGSSSVVKVVPGSKTYASLTVITISTVKSTALVR